MLIDTARGIGSYLISYSTDAAQTGSNWIDSFNSNGFTMNSSSFNGGATYASWTFRKQPKFFTQGVYTGTGSVQTIAHDLGSTPGFIMIKGMNNSFAWICYHSSVGATQFLALNSTQTAISTVTAFNNTEPTSSNFTVGTSNAVNQIGQQFVYYAFAHDAGGFGLAGTDNVVSCGTYTGNGSTTGPVITLGYEPQWLLYKRTNVDDSWILVDNMRGFPVTGNTTYLNPNNSFTESNFPLVSPLATGFQPRTADSTTNASGGTYVYIAIRRGPMKVPTSGTSVFKPFYASYSEGAAITTDFPLDLSMWKANTTYNWSWQDRLRGWPTASGSGGPALASNTTGAETTAYQNVGAAKFDSNTGAVVSYQADSGRSNEAAYFMFRRAPSFFDEVCYTGTGSATTFAHNLGVVPEIMIVKRRSTTGEWRVYVSSIGANSSLKLQTDEVPQGGSAFWDSTTPTSSVFTVGTSADTNASGSTYINYLFATCAGVSKVGSYTGNGSTQTINCGFTGGSRFVMIKRTDSSDDWILLDTSRSTYNVAVQYLIADTAAVESSDNAIDILSNGFKLRLATYQPNTSGATFVYAAFAENPLKFSNAR
jgi:hypothetical protein